MFDVSGAVFSLYALLYFSVRYYIGNIIENNDRSKVNKISQIFSKLTSERKHVKIALLCKNEKRIWRIKRRDSY